MAKMGRPTIEIDWKQFDKLCRYQCTLVEIAEWFDCSEDTIENKCKEKFGVTFSDIYKKKSASGKRSLRRKMFQMAMKGHPAMMIFLSKQMLGYKDQVEQVVESEVKTTIIYDTEWGNSSEPSDPKANP